MRVFLANYFGEQEQPVHINELPDAAIAYHRETFDNILGFETADMLPEQVNMYRPDVYQLMSRQPAFRFVKTHEKFTRNGDGIPVFGHQESLRAILIVRNPWDVAISMSHFYGRPIDEMIHQMASENLMFSRQDPGLSDHFPHAMGSWSTFVASWVESGVQLHVVKYEDLLAEPEDAFECVVNFIEGEVDLNRLRRAILFSTFDTLRKQEDEFGFFELTTGADRFFRKGIANNWHAELTSEQFQMILANHESQIRKLGYRSS